MPARTHHLLGPFHALGVAATLTLLTIVVVSSSARAQAHDAPARRYTCPIDGAQTAVVGHDGRSTLRRYSDLEEPTRAYQNQVLACPKCGYANWKYDFERAPDGRVVQHVHAHFKKSARAAATDPIVAYRHHLNLLHARRAPIAEQIGAALHYTYVIKKARPYGGMDAKTERKLVKARVRVVQLLQYAMKKEPPRRERGQLEWSYLIGELLRLTGRPGEAANYLRDVCEKKRAAGHTIGRLACEMSARAERKETWEDFRDGVFDVRGIDAAEKRAQQAAEKAKADALKPKVVKPPPGTRPEPADPAKPKDPPARTENGAAGADKTKPPASNDPAKPPDRPPEQQPLQPEQPHDPLAPPPPPPAK